VRSLTSRPSPRAGRLLGTVVGIGALGTAASTAVLVVSSALGSGHTDTASTGHPAPASAAAHAAVEPAPGPSMDGMPAMPDDPSGTAGMESDGLSLYAIQTGTLGVVATDGAGRLLYGSVGDANNPSASHCTGVCAQEWQPVIIPKGQRPELLGVYADKVGQVSRDDGSSQLTLGGWPVYVNRDDDGGLTAVASAHGSWFVITPQGQKIPV
jgi:predicted lipoprotein with Yx(FWY)xxD motif